jgi:hypothetical protein
MEGFSFRVVPFLVGCAFGAAILGGGELNAQSIPTVTVRHAPALNGPGRIEGSAQQLLGENVTLNGGFTIAGDFLVPGTPTLQINGTPTFAGTIIGTGSASPTSHRVTLNGNVSLGYLRTRTDPIALPIVPPPPAPLGTRSVTITAAGQSIGNPATLRNLTLNGNVGQVVVPPGTYGNFVANGGSGFTLGAAGATTPVVYNLQNLTLNGSTRMDVVGPIILTVASGFIGNGLLGTTNQSSRLQLQLASGGLALNGGCTMHGSIEAPAGTVTINGNSCLIGPVKSDRLIINGNGCIKGGTAAANQPPVADAQNVTTAEDTSRNITLTGNDPEGGTLIYTILTPPTRGSLLGTAPNLTYRPGLNENGTDSFTFKVNDGAQDSAAATVTITLTPVNDAPTAQPQNVSTAEDTDAPITLVGSDVDGNPLTFTVATQPQHGILINPPPTLIYVPDPNYHGPDSFTFRVNDGLLNSAPATVNVTVNPLNDRPVAEAQALSVTEDTARPVTLTGTDPENDPLVFTVLAQPFRGTLSGIAPNLAYVPAPNFSGVDAFTFRVSDGGTNSVPATISLTILPVNDRPIAFPTNYTTIEDTAASIVITASDIEDTNLTYNVVTQPEHGSVTGAGRNLTYSPASDYHGADSFTFKASDGVLDSEVAVVSLTISSVNDAPVANAKTVTTDEDMATAITLSGTDADGDLLTFAVISPPTHGTLSGDAPNVLYIPDPDYSGSDSFTCAASDGSIDSAAATVSITVNSVNDPPVAEEQLLATDEDTALPLTLVGSDVDGDALSFAVVAPPLYGVLSGASPNLVYTPDANFSGTDSLIYVADDGQSGSELATILIEVIPQNDPPTAAFQGVLTPEDTPVPILLSGNDLDGDALSFVITTPPGHGTLSFNSQLPSSQLVTYTPVPNFHGSDSFTFIVSDGSEFSPPAVVSIDVTPVNDPPLAVGGSFETEQDTPIPIHVAGMDVDGDALSFRVVAAPEHGTLSGTGPEYLYTPAAGFAGSDGFSFVANDGDADSPAAGVTIVVGATESGAFMVEAGPDQVIVAMSATLSGRAVIASPVVGEQTNVVWTKTGGRGSAQFANATALTTEVVFSEPGAYTLKLQVSYNGGQRSDTLIVVVLAAVPERISAARSSRGSDFWLTFLDNAHPFGEPAHSGLSFTVTAETDTTGLVSFFGQGEWHTNFFEVRAGVTTVVPIADFWSDPTLADSDTVQNNAIHIATANEVSVHALNYLDFTTDGYLALPTALLGTEYIVLGYQNSPDINDPTQPVGGTQFAIVATEDNTRVTILPTLTTGSRVAGVPYEVVMQEGQTYRLMNVDSLNGDLSGTTITADKPIAVFGGHQCANVPPGVFACDHLVEQLPPVNQWGRQFVTMPLASRSVGDTFRILAMTDDTLLAVNGEVVARLNRGQFHERTNVGPTQITASQPVLVAQYANGSAFDGTTGDPFMMLVPPAEQFGASYTVGTPRLFDYFAFQYADIFANHLTLIVRTNGTGAIQIDGIPVAASAFQPIGASGYSGAHVPVNPGTHRLTGGVPFGVSLYGWAPFESYAYIGGIYSESVEADTQLALRQTSDRTLVGSEKVVIASVANGRQRPLAGVEVTFTVTGVNGTTRRIRTNPFGEAVFAYTGLIAGEDVIQAVVVDLQQSMANTWLQASDNLPPTVNAGSPQLISMNQTAHLAATVSDDGKPFGGTLTYQWRTASGYVPARFTQPDQPTTDVAFDLPGVYSLELTVSDSMFSARSSVTITVNDVPRIRSLSTFPFEQPYSIGQEVTFSAHVTDSDGSVANVEFFAGETKIGESGPPGETGLVSINWIVPTPGSHSITVVVTDNLGGSTRSMPLTIQSVSPPLVEWLSPLDGLEATAGVPLQLRISATDLDGTVSNVLFVVDHYTPNFNRAEFPAIGSGPNYTGTWTPPRAGDYYFYAFARDDDGAAGVALVYVRVTAPVPTVTLQAHLPSSEHCALVGYPLLLAAEVTVVEPVRIERVEFYQGSTFIDSITNGPYLLTYAPTNPGTYSFTVRAVTEVGSSGDSAPVSVTAVPFLKVLWEDPRETEWVPLGSTRLLSIRLQDLGGIFSNVTFVVDGLPLATTDFTFVDWTPIAAGDHTLQARVTDSFGNTYLNEELVLRVAELHAPQVRIVQPVNGARFAAGMPVNFLAEATDSDNVVTNLSLHLYSAAETSVSGGPLTYSWQGLPPGEHEFTASATDNTGQKGEARVRIIVEPPLNAGLGAPQNLLAEPLGCNAIKISWHHPSTDTNEVIVVERAIGASEVWEPVGYLLTEESSMENHGLAPMTSYRYRAYLRSGTGERSPFSNQAIAATRPYLPNYAVLDLTESLVDDGVAIPISAQLKRRSQTELMRASLEHGAPVSGPARTRLWKRAGSETGAPTRFMLPRRDSRTVKARHDLRHVNNGSPLDLGLTAAFGLSDNNEVLLLDPLNTANPKSFLWRPNAEALQFDRGTFAPYRLADLGAIVGANLELVQDSQGQTIQRWHAGVWVGTFLDFTPDVSALRVPIGHPPHPDPYPTLNALLDMSPAGFGVGLATWLYFPDENPSSAPLTAVKHATLWPTNGEPPVTFGALQQLNNESGFWAINEEGEMVGQSRLFDATRPAVAVTHAVRSHVSLADGQSNDKLEDLGTLGGDFSAALTINQDGTAVGYSTVQPDGPIQDTRAVYWRRDDVSPRPLPGYGVTNHSYAWDIDGRQAIIGQAVRTGGGAVAALWLPNTAESDSYTLMDLNDYTSNSKWFLTSAQYINTNGVIVGSGMHSRSSFIDGERIESAPTPRTYLLLPNVSLAVDYNRDGKIELNDKDNLPPGQPYQFWVNDDTDAKETGRDSILHAQPAFLDDTRIDSSNPDYFSPSVDGNQDLVDWFPVYFNISNLLALLPPGVNEYYVVHSEGELNFLYSDLSPDSSGRYLTNLMSSGFGVNFTQAPAQAEGVTRITETGVALSSDFLSRIGPEGKGILLIEARKATSEPLRLEVRNTRRVVATVELPLRIGNVEDMYGWYNMRFVIGDPGELPTNFRPSNAPRFADPAASFVFLHGYNVNEKQSRDWSIEMFKRMWWTGSRRRYYAVSWPGDTTQLGPLTINYHLNVQQAFDTAPAFARFVNSPMLGGDVTVAAHSLANMVVSPAIQDHGARPTRYLMVDAAVAMEAYDAGLPKEPAMIHPDWRSYTNRLYASEWHTLFPDSDGRNGLTWRGRFKDVHKLTQLYNFYSSGEEVLENNSLDNEKPTIPDVLGYKDGSILPGTLPWALQELLKGRVTTSDFYALYAFGGLALDAFLLHAGVHGGNVVGSKYAGWGFNPDWDTSGSTRTVNVGGTSIQIYVSGGRLSPGAAEMITDPELRTNSFFLTFLDEDMYHPLGNWLASDPDTRTRLLAEAIPALTFATGANAFPKSSAVFGEIIQFDMNKTFQKRGWPLERLHDRRRKDRWFHSDVRDIPYHYNGDVFKKWFDLGGGR